MFDLRIGQDFKLTGTRRSISIMIEILVTRNVNQSSISNFEGQRA
jgi:hypothetical protein